MSDATFINPDVTSFEAELGELCKKWIGLQGLDSVIEGLDYEVIALEGRRDATACSRLPE